MKNKLCKLFTSRRIQIDIIVIFIALIGITSLIITGYTYKKYYADITELSTEIIERTDRLTVEKAADMKESLLLTVEVVSGSLLTQAEAEGKDLDYTDFLINILRKDALLTQLGIVTPKGDYFCIIDAKDEEGLDYYSAKDLPYGTNYVIRTITKKEDSFLETWKYIGQGDTVLKVESNPTDFDFTKDPWFLKMKKEPFTHWARELIPKGIDGERDKKIYAITLSDVVKDAQGDIFAVLSMSVSLKKLSDFVKGQVIGKDGGVFVLSDKGDVKLPLGYGSTPDQALREKLLKRGLLEHKKSNKAYFSLTQDGKKYLFSFHRSIFFPHDTWFRSIVVPYDDFFGDTIKTQHKTIAMSLAIFVLCAITTYFSTRHIVKPVVQMAKEVDRIRDFDFTEPKFLNSHIKEIIDLESSVNAMRAALHSFGRYVPKEIVRTLIKYGQDVGLGGDRKEVTVMFSDIENFTTISESLPIEELMPLLADYFDVLSKIVLSSEGTIDKYIGDSVMSFWGAPLQIDNQAEKACIACLTSSAAVKKQNKWNTRFGVHTGDVIVGNIGTNERLNYTVIGDTVNVASRLEGINKEYGTFVMISEVVYEKIGAGFVTRPIDFVAVKGKRKKLRIFELMGTRAGELAATKEQVELAELFTKAYHLFEEEKLKEAKEAFLAIEKQFPQDAPTKKYLERLG